MGVKSLHTYMKEDPTTYYKVSIEDVLNKKRAMVGHNQPTVVVDGSGCVRTMYGEINLFTGGQFKRCCENIERFVKLFKDLNIKLVVFFDCHVPQDKMQVWTERRYTEEKRVRDILSALNNNKVPKPDQIPTELGLCVKYKFQELLIEVKTSLHRESDDDIIAYANASNCIAVVGNDTDFIMAPGSWIYLRGNNMDLEHKTAFIYDKEALLRKLGLRDQNQLPLMATLIGNDKVPFQYLQNWHYSICDHRGGYLDNKKRFSKIAQYVRSVPDEFHLHKNRDKHFKQISCDVFQRKLYRQVRDPVRLLKRSVDSYLVLPANSPPIRVSGNINWDGVMEKAWVLDHRCKIPSSISVIFIHRSFHQAMGFELFNHSDELPAAGLLWRPFRAKLYGILLQECSNHNPVNEWVMTGHGSLDRPIAVALSFPVEPHPGLLALWSDDRELDDCRWNLFTSTWSPDIPVGRLRDLPLRLVTAVLVITYMLKPCRLDDFEWQSLLMTADVCSEGPVPPEVEADTNVPIDTRALRLSTVYIRGVSLVGMLTSACGFPVPFDMTFIWNLFDGLLFQKYYRERELLLPVENSDLKIAFDFINDYSGLFT